ncbi:MAG: phage baseplate assembly protein V [Oscillospiraceae bacterium]|jgi:uncharacterized protein involved in type VI secretion and phage assembly|nr:phage baseplate assembly protein V [Oscillospiraceae bacterium]
MALYDIINEISAKSITKTETGDTLINGVALGVVAKNYDRDMPGRICVTIPTRDKDANEMQWARIVQSSGGSTWGYYFIPEVGDQVMLAFEGGNVEKPYIIGCVPKDNSKFLNDAFDENNQFKRIVTKNGNTLSFEDNKEGTGENDKIALETAGKSLVLRLDNENKTVLLSDKEKENMIQFKTEDGQIDIKAKSKLTVNVGDSIKITLNGESGSVIINAESVSITASNQFKMKSDDLIGIEGAQVSANASSTLKLEGNVVNVGGGTVRLG